jgi:hypothetical protein
MASDGRAPEPTELVYEAGSSWAPAFLAFGLAGVLVGFFAGWAWIVVGAALGLLALRSWIRAVGDDLRRLPRRQEPTTATLPATPMRTARRG